MKKTCAVLLAVILLAAALTGCRGYSSSYKAVAFVHSNTASNAFMSYYSFDGTMVFKLKASKGDKLVFSGKVETGSVMVFYADSDGDLIGLFEVGDGEELQSSTAVDRNLIWQNRVWIVVKTNGQSKNGSFDFTIEHGE